MDPRKQKRLGPAPIASFEKSFEDNSAIVTTTSTVATATTATSQQQQQQEHQQQQQQLAQQSSVAHGSEATAEMASHENNLRRQTAAAAAAAATSAITTNVSRDECEEGSISATTAMATATATASGTGTATATATATTPAAVTFTGSTKQRPPPLKTATATVTTTLVSSNEGGQPLPLPAHAAMTLGSYRGTATLTTPSTPRIELSRASSSSHHEEDSRDSSPENVFEQVGTGTLQETIGLGFREEGALELRSSTEELYFMDPEQKKEEQDKLKQQHQQQEQQQYHQHPLQHPLQQPLQHPQQIMHQQPQPQQQQQPHQHQAKRMSPHMFKFDEHQSYLQQHQRKDSASSEVAALLCISGRTSRISSVGSQGSAVSRLSAVSGVSRSPSPHRMLLETSFCGPKPTENEVEGAVGGAIMAGGGAATAAGGISAGYAGLGAAVGGGMAVTAGGIDPMLEQVLLARKQDPTQVVLAEGIKVESSPVRKSKPTTLSNGATKLKATTSAQAAAKAADKSSSLPMGAQRRSTKSPGQMVVGKTPSGTEYIRINLRPDHMYSDKGIAPNERVVEAPNQLTPVYSKSQPQPHSHSYSHAPSHSQSQSQKPASLCLQGRSTVVENRLTPTASPKPSRHVFLTKDTRGSRSPSPATVSVSRKSSFSSLFRLGGKDSPDSPRERSRSRSKSKDRQTPQSQNVTPSKQKSVLAIFKPGKRGSSAGTDTKSSKSSSPIDGGFELQLQHPLPPPQMRSRTPVVTATGSRPNSRLRYYDEPIEGVIHIPLHTPPEEKEARQLLQGIQQLNAEPVVPVVPVVAPITASDLAAAAAALKPVGQRKGSGTTAGGSSGSSTGTVSAMRLQQTNQRIENLDAIHTLPQDDDNKERTWSLEVNRHSSQDSQDTVNSDGSYASAIRLGAARLTSHLAHVKEHVVHENGMDTEAEAEIHRLPSVDSTISACEPRFVQTVATVNVISDDAVARERRRLLFATRLGSGSQEQIFSTQFSISKTESQSSQLSEQIPESISEGAEGLQRQGTVIRRTDEETNEKTNEITTIKRLSSIDKQPKSVSASEDEKTQSQTQIATPTETTPTAAAVVLRRKESNSDEGRNKSRSTSEEEATVTGDVASQRHSRYLENFDVRKKYHENVLRKPKRQSISESSPVAADECMQQKSRPTLPQPPPPSTAPSPSPPPHAVSGHTADSRSSTPSAHPRSRSQSQSPVERSRQTPTKPPRATTPTRRPQTPVQAPASSSATVNTIITTPPSPLLYSPPSAAATPQQYRKPMQTADRQSIHSTDEPVDTSESERDSDLAGHSSAATTVATDPKRRHLPRHVGLIEDHESTGLVSQESFDDELPYIPTTLPEERAHGVSIIPMRERANMELKTCPVDRPRSTTPLNPSHLEEYCGIVTPSEPTGHELSGLGLTGHGLGTGTAIGAGVGVCTGTLTTPVRGEKLRISLPRKDSTKEKTQNAKSPRRISNASGKSWFEFAEEGLRANASNLERKDSNKQLMAQVTAASAAEDNRSRLLASGAIPKPHVTPTASTSTQRKLSGHWIDFENIPEKRKPAKRITALPKEATQVTATSRSGSGSGQAEQQQLQQHQHQYQHHHYQHHHQQQPQQHQHQHHQQPPDVTAAADGHKLHYNYVKPEDCQCECHEVERETCVAASIACTDADAEGGGSVGTATGTGSSSADSKSAASGPPFTTQAGMLPELDEFLGKTTTPSVVGMGSRELMQQGEDMLPLIEPDAHDGAEPSDSSREYSCYTDDDMELPVRQHSASSRSKSGSSKLEEFPRRDATQSPNHRNRKFPDNRI